VKNVKGLPSKLPKGQAVLVKKYDFVAVTFCCGNIFRPFSVLLLIGSHFGRFCCLSEV